MPLACLRIFRKVNLYTKLTDLLSFTHGVTGLFYVKRGCQFQNAVSYWLHSRQNWHFGHILAKCCKIPV